MIFLELDLAIYKRLTGAPLDSKGLPALDPTTRIPVNRSRVLPPDHGGGEGPSYGVRIPHMKHPHDVARGLTSKDQNAIPLFGGISRDTFRQVPVFDENMEGRKWVDVWPCVTFRWNGLAPDDSPGAFIYYDSIVSEDPEATTINIVNRNGDVVDTGKSARYKRPHPEPYKAQYAIVARAKNKIELGLICSQIMYLFPRKGAVVVEYANGETQAVDMSLDNVVTTDDGGDQIAMSVTPDEQRGFSRMFLYQVESYMDNTTNYYGMQDVTHHTKPILARILEIQDRQSLVMRTWELNALEVETL